MGRLVDVEGPAIGREGLQLEHQGDEHEEDGQRRAGEAERGRRDVVDIERAVGVVDEDDADEQQDRDDLGDDQVFEAGGDGAFVFARGARGRPRR